jgi:ATP synthase protein I
MTDCVWRGKFLRALPTSSADSASGGGVFIAESRFMRHKSNKNQRVDLHDRCWRPTIVEVAPENGRLLYFYGFAGRFSITSMSWDRPPRRFCHYLGCRVLNSIAAGRSVAFRAVACQLAAVVMVALLFLAVDWSASLAALLGGIGMVLGNALAASIALGGGVVTARSAFSRLMLGTGLKWLVVITIFAIASGVWRMAPLPLLAGLAVALIAHPLVLNFCVRVERER